MGIKLASVEVKNFRSIWDPRDEGPGDGKLVLELGNGMNALVAPNNVGKSNVLKAIALALGEDHGDGFLAERDRPTALQWAVPSITLDFRLEVPLSTPEATLLRRAEEYERSVGGLSTQTYAGRGRVRLRVKYQGDSRVEFLASRGSGDRQGDPRLNERALDQLRKCVRFVFIRSGESLETFLAGRFREVLRNVLEDSHRDEVRRAEQLRGDYVAGLRDSLLSALQGYLASELGEIVPEITAVELTPEVPGLDATLAAADIRLADVARTGLAEKGTGIRGGLLVAMLRYLTEHSKRSLVFAVEEPESFLHPQAQLELRRDLEALAERPDATLLVTTHSPFILSRAPEARVFRLGKRSDGGTTVLADAWGHEECVDAISDLFGGIAPLPRMIEDASRVEGSRGIVIVEGQTDATYLRRAAELHRRPELLEGVHLICAGGAEAAVVQAVTWTERKVAPVVVLLDADAHGRRARQRLTGDFKLQGKRVLTYAKWAGGAQDGVEAEDLFPQEFLEAFITSHGESHVLGEKRQIGPTRWHFGLTQAGKELFGRHVEKRATASDLAGFIPVLEAIHAAIEEARTKGGPVA
jgi:5S rRNA maturation endonuclease (ribonuclease M5)